MTSFFPLSWYFVNERRFDKYLRANVSQTQVLLIMFKLLALNSQLSFWYTRPLSNRESVIGFLDGGDKRTKCIQLSNTRTPKHRKHAKKKRLFLEWMEHVGTYMQWTSHARAILSVIKTRNRKCIWMVLVSVSAGRNQLRKMGFKHLEIQITPIKESVFSLGMGRHQNLFAEIK